LVVANIYVQRINVFSVNQLKAAMGGCTTQLWHELFRG